LARRGRALAGQGLWPRAADDFAAALAHGRDEPAVRAAAALTRLAAGDPAGYRQACRELRDRWSAAAHGEEAKRMAWACLVAPEGPAEARPILEWVERLTAGTRDRAESAALRGAALARAGRWEEAAVALRAAQSLGRGDEPARAELFLALVHHAQKKDEEAQACLERADRRIDRLPPDATDPEAWLRQLELRLLREDVGRRVAAPVPGSPALPLVY
jgi:tetratricopeptide (TPR) repeat protein